MNSTPRWLRSLEKYLGWIAVPYLGVLIVTLQGLGFLLVASNPDWRNHLALFPERVWAGEYWRLLTFLALPNSTSPFWLFFVLWFLYFIIDSLEKEWGAFQTTFYVLFTAILTVAFSLFFEYPIVETRHFETTLFLAVATLFPEYEVRLFFVFPVKMKWLGFLSGAFVLFDFISGGWLERLYLLCMYSSFLVFFGPVAIYKTKLAYRRWKMRQLR